MPGTPTTSPASWPLCWRRPIGSATNAGRSSAGSTWCTRRGRSGR
jgi:hypothetical protein